MKTIELYRGTHGHAEVFEDAAGGWRWRCKGANGEIVATSESYTTSYDAERGFNDAAEIMCAAIGSWR